MKGMETDGTWSIRQLVFAKVLSLPSEGQTVVLMDSGGIGRTGTICTTPGQPQQFQIRIQLKRNNQDYGQLSDIVTVTANP